MHLTDQQVKSFQDIYFKEYEENIDEKTARMLGTKLVNLLDALFTKNEHKHGKSWKID